MLKKSRSSTLKICFSKNFKSFEPPFNRIDQTYKNFKQRGCCYMRLPFKMPVYWTPAAVRALSIIINHSIVLLRYLPGPLYFFTSPRQISKPFSWLQNPKFGCTILRHLIRSCRANSKDIISLVIRYAKTAVALRLIPNWQWTSTAPERIPWSMKSRAFSFIRSRMRSTPSSSLTAMHLYVKGCVGCIVGPVPNCKTWPMQRLVSELKWPSSAAWLPMYNPDLTRLMSIVIRFSPCSTHSKVCEACRGPFSLMRYLNWKRWDTFYTR